MPAQTFMSSGARATSAPLARHADVSQVFCTALAERAHVLRVTMVVDEMDELRRFVLAKLRG